MCNSYWSVNISAYFSCSFCHSLKNYFAQLNCVKLYTFFYLAFMSEKNNLKTHTYFNFDVIGLWLKIKKNAHCEKIHTTYAAVIYQTGPKILAHFTIQSNVAWKTVFLESGYVCLIVCLLHGQENAFMPCYIAHLSEFNCRVLGKVNYGSRQKNVCCECVLLAITNRLCRQWSYSSSSYFLAITKLNYRLI